MQIVKQLLLVRPSDRRGLVTFLTLEAWCRGLIERWWHREGTSNKSAQPGRGTVPAAKEPGHKGTLEGIEIPGQYTKQWMHPPHRGLGGAQHIVSLTRPFLKGNSLLYFLPFSFSAFPLPSEPLLVPAFCLAPGHQGFTQSPASSLQGPCSFAAGCLEILFQMLQNCLSPERH